MEFFSTPYDQADTDAAGDYEFGASSEGFGSGGATGFDAPYVDPNRTINIWTGTFSDEEPLLQGEPPHTHTRRVAQG